eukprot:m.6344 g.6344  ORF g.6344 m.6344 type:complete len:710 (+) comp4107_c0_seq1:68-2197(+)
MSASSKTQQASKSDTNAAAQTSMTQVKSTEGSLVDCYGQLIQRTGVSPKYSGLVNVVQTSTGHMSLIETFSMSSSALGTSNATATIRKSAALLSRLLVFVFTYAAAAARSTGKATATIAAKTPIFLEVDPTDANAADVAAAVGDAKGQYTVTIPSTTGADADRTIRRSQLKSGKKIIVDGTGEYVDADDATITTVVDTIILTTGDAVAHYKRGTTANNKTTYHLSSPSGVAIDATTTVTASGTTYTTSPARDNDPAVLAQIPADEAPAPFQGNLTIADNDNIWIELDIDGSMSVLTQDGFNNTTAKTVTAGESLFTAAGAADPVAATADNVTVTTTVPAGTDTNTVHFKPHALSSLFDSVEVQSGMATLKNRSNDSNNILELLDVVETVLTDPDAAYLTPALTGRHTSAAAAKADYIGQLKPLITDSRDTGYQLLHVLEAFTFGVPLYLPKLAQEAAFSLAVSTNNFATLFTNEDATDIVIRDNSGLATKTAFTDNHGQIMAAAEFYVATDSDYRIALDVFSQKGCVVKDIALEGAVLPATSIFSVASQSVAAPNATTTTTVNIEYTPYHNAQFLVLAYIPTGVKIYDLPKNYIHSYKLEVAGTTIQEVYGNAMYEIIFDGMLKNKQFKALYDMGMTIIPFSAATPNSLNKRALQTMPSSLPQTLGEQKYTVELAPGAPAGKLHLFMVATDMFMVTDKGLVQLLVSTSA